MDEAEKIREIIKEKGDLPTKTDKFEVIRMNLLSLQVCSPIAPEQKEELIEAIHRDFPSGTSNNWSLREDGDAAPVKCSEKDGHWHYLFNC